MVRFEFKRNMWTNQEVTPRYRLPALVIDGTAQAGSNTDDTARPGRPVALPATRPTTSSTPGGRYRLRRKR
jgi:hypothetical protein